MAPRFPHTLTLIRPEIGQHGDWTFPAGSSIRGFLVPVKRREIVNDAGDVSIVVAQAWLPRGTDVRRSDRLVRGSHRFVVVQVADGEDDLAYVDHVGVQLSTAPRGG